MWRAMQKADLKAVEATAAAVHPDFPEGPEVFAERFELFPDGCRVVSSAGAGVAGYAVIHPATLRKPPALNSLLGRLPADADCLYLHDVALLSAVRGKGLAGEIVVYADVLARRGKLRALALVAVNGSAPVWSRLGFERFEADDALRAKLDAYGREAVYMTKACAGG